MNQPFDEELISAYLDDELSPEERSDVERLLTERPEAQRLLDELRGLRESLQSLPVYKLQEDFGAAVLRRAERELLRTPPSTITPPSNGTPSSDGASATTNVVSVPTTPAAPIQPAAVAERNWRRPAAWSLLAVAAALVLMYVDRNQRDVQVAMNPALEKERAIDKSAAPLRKVGPAEDRVAGVNDQLKRMDRPAELATDRGALAKPGPMLKAGPGDASVAASAKSQTEAVVNSNGVAGQPLPAGHQFMIMNSVPATMPPAAAPGAHLAIENRLPGTPPADGVADAPQQNQLAQQVLAGAGVGGAALPAQQLGVDMTPLIRSNDYQRARALVTEYEVARREVPTDRDAAAELQRRVQNRSLEQQAQQRTAPLQAKTGIAVDRAFDALAANTDQLLIVQCDVTAEALERGWAPILNREQIADLTTISAGTTTVNGGLQRGNGIVSPTPAAPPQPQEGEADEEFVYLVANSKQMEATLDALRRQSEYFLNVRVEPAAADARQTAWRSRYSRSDDAGGLNSYAVKNAPAPVNPASPVPAPAVVVPAPVTPPPVAMPKKVAEVTGDRKQLADKDSSIAKTENAAAASQPLNEGSQLREPEMDKLLFGSGNSPAGAVGGSGFRGTAQTSNALAPQSGYAYQLPQSVVPLSRSQRLNRADVYAPTIAALPQSAAKRDNNVAAPATTASPTGQSDVAQAGNKLSSSTASGGGASAPTSATPAPAPTTAPNASAAVTTLGDERKEKAKLATDLQAAGKLGAVASQPAPDEAAREAVSGEPAAAWHELPPDYHEALFIFRVVNKPTVDAKPAAKPAQQ